MILLQVDFRWILIPSQNAVSIWPFHHSR